MKYRRILIFLIILLGLLLRVWGIDFGLPHIFHADESHTINLSASLGHNLLNPKIFWKPALVYYLIALQYGIYFILGKIIGAFASLDDFIKLFVLNPTSFYLIARISIGAVFGVLSIPVIYAIGKRLYSQRLGTLCALLLATAFIHVQNSHYAAHDIPVLFFILMVVLYSLDISQYGKRSDYVKAGIFFALAIATKYNAALAFPAVIIAHILFLKEKGNLTFGAFFSGNIFIFGVVSIALFFLVNPFIIIDFKAFLETFHDLASVEGYTGFTHHIKISLLQGVGIGIFLTAVAGFLFLFKMFKAKAWVFLSVPFFYYMHLVFYSQQHERYILVLVPFCIISSACFLEKTAQFLKRRYGTFFAGTALTVLIFLSAIPTLAKTIYADILFTRKDTRVIAAEWIESNIPAGSYIAFDNTFLTPTIKQSYRQLKQKERIIKQKNLSELQAKKLDILLAFCEKDKSPRYNTFYPSDSIDEDKNIYIFSSYPRFSLNAEGLAKNHIQYVVLSDRRTPKAPPSWMPESAALLKTISPYRKLPDFGDTEYTSDTAGPFIDKDVFSRNNPGPILRIYKIK